MCADGVEGGERAGGGRTSDTNTDLDIGMGMGMGIDSFEDLGTHVH